MAFSWLAIVMAGLLGTLAMTTMMLLAHAVGASRMNPGFYLGAWIFGLTRTAYGVGLTLHFAIGVVAAIVYAWILSAWGVRGGVSWGLLLGFIHWFMAMLLYGVLGAMHPRVRRHEMVAPGFFAMNEGWTEPASRLLEHLVYGAVVGGTLLMMRNGADMTVPYSFDSWMQPQLGPSIAYLVFIVALCLLFIAAATVTVQLGPEEVFAAAAPPDAPEPDWLIAEIRNRYEQGLITRDQFEAARRALLGES
jgi:uncharacterized membrane protein YagU involved in acid resistance